jgi:hypothetical protein
MTVCLLNVECFFYYLQTDCHPESTPEGSLTHYYTTQLLDQ